MQEVEVPRFKDSRHKNIVSLTHRPPLELRKYLWNLLLLEAAITDFTTTHTDTPALTVVTWPALHVSELFLLRGDKVNSTSPSAPVRSTHNCTRRILLSIRYSANGTERNFIYPHNKIMAFPGFTETHHDEQDYTRISYVVIWTVCTVFYIVSFILVSK